jgi:hypothetical protein
MFYIRCNCLPVGAVDLLFVVWEGVRLVIKKGVEGHIEFFRWEVILKDFGQVKIELVRT